jgi:arsenate reductase-like glutaredoxin family protein
LLSQRGVEFEERDFFKYPLSEGELRGLAKLKPLSELFSWRSPSFKAMGLEERSLSPDDLIRLMAQEPRLIRRPLVKVDDQLIVGSDWKAVEAALQKA